MNFKAFSMSQDSTWTTPKGLFDELHKKYRFGLDAAALSTSTLVPESWYGPDHLDEKRRDALSRSWLSDTKTQTVWLNPPYGRLIGLFLKKASEEATKGATVVCLIPARTDTRWFHEYCLNYEIKFIKGRLKFGSSTNSAPFPSALVVMR